MKKIQSNNSSKYKAALCALTMLTALSSASPSYADTGSAGINSYTPGTIEIASNGSEYTAPVIALVSLSAQLQIQLDAGVSGRVKSWAAAIILNDDFDVLTPFGHDSESYSTPRPKTVNTVAVINVPYGTIAPFATAQCNSLADNLRTDGLSNEQIFAQDRTIEFGIRASVSWDMSGFGEGVADGYIQEAPYPKFNLVCKASPQPAPNPTRNIPDVEQVSLNILEVTTLNGACKLNVSGFIRTKEANTEVKFRYKDNTGQQSDIKTVTTDQGETVGFVHQYRLYGGGNKSGQIRIDVEGESTRSAWADYNVDCNPNAAPGGWSQNQGDTRTDLGRSAVGGIQQQQSNNPAAPVAGGLKTTPQDDTTRTKKMGTRK